VRNYKSFLDSGVVALPRKFTVFLGQNNSGKSALLDTLRNQSNQNNPHRDLAMRGDAVADPNSSFHLEVEVTANELFDSLMRSGEGRWIAFPREADPGQFVKRLFYESGTSAQLEYGPTGLRRALGRLGHQGMTDDGGNLAVQVSPSSDRQSFTVSGKNGTPNDQLGDLLPPIVSAKLFVFTAERVNLNQSAVAAPSQISANAGNLARALLAMSEQPILWEEFNLNVNRVLPNVKRVVPSIIEGQNTVEIRLWPVDPKEQRPDLIVPLSRSGTGVGQVLAILCAAMTVRQAVIGIDEPSNFLHPGAVKALFGILNSYDHQYVVTTHSLDVIGASGDVTVYMIKWKDCVSSVQEVPIGNFQEHKTVLGELGVSLSDVLGMDTVLWVEGETEELCVPRVIQKMFGYAPGNIGVVRVRSVSELADKKKGAALWDVYKLLSSSGGSVPATTRFIFDREVRSELERADIRRASKGEAAFLPRRTFENYLLGSELLLAELNAEATAMALESVTSEVLLKWLSTNAVKFSPADSWNGDPTSVEWKRDVDAPALLNALFKEFLKSEYRKVRNSPSLTHRLLAAGGDDCVELENFIGDVLGR